MRGHTAPTMHSTSGFEFIFKSQLLPFFLVKVFLLSDQTYDWLTSSQCKRAILIARVHSCHHRNR